MVERRDLRPAEPDGESEENPGNDQGAASTSPRHAAIVSGGTVAVAMSVRWLALAWIAAVSAAGQLPEVRLPRVPGGPPTPDELAQQLADAAYWRGVDST